MIFEAPSASYTSLRYLQGKPLPVALSGELLRVDLPYGVGLSMIMWALTETMQKRTVATALKESLVEAIPWEICVSSLFKLFDTTASLGFRVELRARRRGREMQFL